MIPRYQKILFAVLLVAAVIMAVVLIRLRERAQDRLLAGNDNTPTSAPHAAPPETVQLLIANDVDGSLIPQARQLPLPTDAGARARLLLEKLFEVYNDPRSPHPIQAQGGVEQVFLMPIPTDRSGRSSGQMAIVNLRGAFADAHPSGIEAETLTILSVCGTLHANLPQITQVRFLVDGQPRETLAGHADLTRSYVASNLASQAVAGGQP